MAASVHARLNISDVTDVEPYAERYEHIGDEPDEVILTLSISGAASVTFRDEPGNLRTFLEAALRTIEEPEDVPF